MGRRAAIPPPAVKDGNGARVIEIGIVFQHDTGAAMWENPVFNTGTLQVSFGAQANLQNDEVIE